MARDLRGVLSAMCTPFTADGGHVDEAALRDLSEGTIKAGVHGLIPCGSTGEFATLSPEERKRVTEVVLDQARGRVPVAPHVGSTSTAVAVDLARHAERAGADAVMAVNPYYEPLSPDELHGYFRDISDAVNIPIMIYNLPGGTGQQEVTFFKSVGLAIEDVAVAKLVYERARSRGIGRDLDL